MPSLVILKLNPTLKLSANTLKHQQVCDPLVIIHNFRSKSVPDPNSLFEIFVPKLSYQIL